MSTYLISLATGHQAQWTIEYLLAAGATVNALVRNPEKIPSWMNKPSIKVFGRDNGNPEAILKAARGCKGAFVNTFLASEPERQQADLIINACKTAGVESVVACTTFYTGEKSIWANGELNQLLGSYYQSKSSIEDAVRESGLTYTIFRPALVHHDYIMPYVHYNYPDLPKNGTLAHTFNDGVGILHIDEKDIGRYVAAALLDPAKFSGQEIELANEYLTIKDVRDIIFKVTGKEIKERKLTAEEIEDQKVNGILVRFQLWANIVQQSSSAKAVEAKFGIPFTSLEENMEREKTKLLECLSQV